MQVSRFCRLETSDARSDFRHAAGDDAAVDMDPRRHSDDRVLVAGEAVESEASSAQARISSAVCRSAAEAPPGKAPSSAFERSRRLGRAAEKAVAARGHRAMQCFARHNVTALPHDASSHPARPSSRIRLRKDTAGHHGRHRFVRTSSAARCWGPHSKVGNGVDFRTAPCDHIGPVTAIFLTGTAAVCRRSEVFSEPQTINNEVPHD
jgi:hypothetical protein